MTDAFSWRWIFYVNVPVGVLVVVGVMSFARRRESAPRRAGADRMWSARYSSPPA
ncbi:hypothetical protein NKG94_16380 [Micromonospora sp. M12]